MRKCKREWENPMDNVLIDTCDWVCPWIHKLGWTPNVITLIGAIVSLCSIWYLCQDKIILFTVLFLLGYWFDCLDGHYARKYHMETTVGDYLDHIRDITIFVLLILVIVYKYHRILFSFSVLSVLFWVTCLVYAINMIWYIGCLENAPHQYRPHSPTLNWMKSICPQPTHHQIQLLRFFGQGTFFFVMVLLVGILHQESI